MTKENKKRKEKDRKADEDHATVQHATTAAEAPATKKHKQAASHVDSSTAKDVKARQQIEKQEPPVENGTPRRARTPVLLPPTPNSKNARQSAEEAKPSTAAGAAAQRKSESSKSRKGKESQSAKGLAAAPVAAAVQQPAAAGTSAAAKKPPGAATVGSSVAAAGRMGASNAPAAAAAQATPGKRARGRPRVHATSWQEDNKREDVKHGTFSKEEGDAVRAAVQRYARAHQLSEDDLSWLFDARIQGQKGAVTAIAADACPNRKRTAVWSWMSRQLRPVTRGSFSIEEVAQLKELVQRVGTKWTIIGEEMNRLGADCRDVWRQLGAEHGDKIIKGAWSTQEEEELKELIEQEKQLKARVEEAQEIAEHAREDEEEHAAATPVGTPGSRKSARGGQWILDGINWDWIARQLKTRTAVQCRAKWYSIRPSMVEAGEWGKGDDKVMLKAMYNAGYQNIWDVDWHDLVPGRTAQQCRRRWLLMLQIVPNKNNMGLGEQVEYLVDTFLMGERAASERTRAATDATHDGDDTAAEAGTPQTQKARPKKAQPAQQAAHDQPVSAAATPHMNGKAGEAGPSAAGATTAAAPSQAGPSKAAAMESKHGKGKDVLPAAAAAQAETQQDAHVNHKSKAAKTSDKRARQATGGDTAQDDDATKAQPPTKKAKKGQQQAMMLQQPQEAQQQKEQPLAAGSSHAAANKQEQRQRKQAAGGGQQGEASKAVASKAAGKKSKAQSLPVEDIKQPTSTSKAPTSEHSPEPSSTTSSSAPAGKSGHAKLQPSAPAKEPDTTTTSSSSSDSDDDDDDDEAEQRLYQQLTKTAGVYSQAAAEPDSDPDEFDMSSSGEDSDDNSKQRAASQSEERGATSSSDDDMDDNDDASTDDDDESSSEDDAEESEDASD